MNIEEKLIDDTELVGISLFFDLLARFDYEDKKKEKSLLKTGPLASAPKGSVFSTDLI